MTAKPYIKDILDYAIWAPSGDNSQPWRFEVKDHELFIYNLPEKDNPYFNFHRRGSLIAHGGLIENILIAAPHFGYKPLLSLFPAGSSNDLVATISLSQDATVKPDLLFDSIKQRHTNRRAYHTTPLTDEQRQNLLHTPQEIGAGTVKLIESQEERRILGKAGASAEVVILENKLLHGCFFKDVIWTQAEEKKKRHGLFIDTMEFNPIQKLLFSLAKNWTMMRFAIRAGLPKFIAQEDAKLYATGAATGVVALPAQRPTDFINAGRVMQRIWLKATVYKLALQPIVATLFFAQRILAGKTEEVLSQRHVDTIKTAYADIQRIFNLKNECITMMFRIGTAPPASARSSRISTDEKLTLLL